MPSSAPSADRVPQTWRAFSSTTRKANNHVESIAKSLKFLKTLTQSHTATADPPSNATSVATTQDIGALSKISEESPEVLSRLHHLLNEREMANQTMQNGEDFLKSKTFSSYSKAESKASAPAIFNNLKMTLEKVDEFLDFIDKHPQTRLEAQRSHDTQDWIRVLNLGLRMHRNLSRSVPYMQSSSKTHKKRSLTPHDSPPLSITDLNVESEADLFEVVQRMRDTQEALEINDAVRKSLPATSLDQWLDAAERVYSKAHDCALKHGISNEREWRLETRPKRPGPDVLSDWNQDIQRWLSEKHFWGGRRSPIFASLANLHQHARTENENAS